MSDKNPKLWKLEPPRRTPLKRVPIKRNRSYGKHKSAPQKWRDARTEVCENCGITYQRFMVLHHVVYERDVRREGGDIWDPRNAMMLCDGPFSCHSRHHARIRTIPSYKLPQASVEFATELFGPERAYVYLTRKYLDVGTGRFDVLLEQAA